MFNSIYNSAIYLVVKLKSIGLSLPSLKKSAYGQGMVEYALILVLVAVVVIVALSLLGSKVNDVMVTVLCRLDPNTVVTNASTGVTDTCTNLGIVP